MGHTLGSRTVGPTAPPWESVATAIGFESALAAIELRLRSGDERRQAIDAATIGSRRLGLRLILRLRSMFPLFARLLRVALIGLAFTRQIARAVVAQIGLRLLRRHEPRLLPKVREIVAFLVRILCCLFAAGLLRLVLPELLLGGGNEAEIVLGVLVIILRGDRIA